MLHKIREYLDCENEHQLDSDVEIDETFVGGKNKSRHRDKKVEKSQGRSFKDKVPVFGIYQRGGKLVAKVAPDTKAATLSPLLSKYVITNSDVYTDGWDYGNVNSHYTQMSVDHGIGFYGTTLTDESGNSTMICTNGIENE